MFEMILFFALAMLAVQAIRYRSERDMYRSRWKAERRNAIGWGRRYFQSQTRES